MNAYELADFVEISNPKDKSHKEIANMLRQQADRIAELEKENELLTAKLNYMFEQELKLARAR